MKIKTYPTTWIKILKLGLANLNHRFGTFFSSTTRDEEFANRRIWSFEPKMMMGSSRVAVRDDSVASLNGLKAPDLRISMVVAVPPLRGG